MKKNYNNEQLDSLLVSSQHYKQIHQLTLSISKLKCENDILWELTEQCAILLGLSDCVIYQPDFGRNTLTQVAAAGAKKKGDRSILSPITLQLGEGIVGACAESMQTIVVPDLTLDKRYFKDRFDAKSELCVPIVYQKKLLGVIDSEAGSVAFYTSEHCDFLEAIAGIVALKITEIRNFQKVKENEQYLNQILESPKGLFAYSLDSSLKYKTFNKNHARMIKDHLGVDIEIGMNVLSLVRNEDERNNYFDAFERVLSGEEFIIYEEFNSNSGGPTQFLEKFYSPLLSINDKIIGISVFIRERTDVQNRNKQLADKREELIPTINENIKEGIFRFSLKKGFIYSNKALLDFFGMPFPGDKIVDLQRFYVEKDGNAKLLEEMLRKGKLTNKEVHYQRLDGTTFWGLVDCQVTDIDHDTIIDGVVFDITQVKNLAQNLEKTNKDLVKTNSELDQLVYRASHDLRTPICSLLGLHNLLNEMIKKPDQKELLVLMEGQLNQLDGIIGDIITYRKIAQLGLSKDKISFQKMIGNILESLKFMNNFSKICKTISIKGDAEFVNDKRNVHVILNNIISNAIKYSRSKIADPFIKIKATVAKNKVEIIVEENGIGIEEKFKKKIFNMFYRATNHSIGSGLGLFIVKESLNKLNGRVKVVSKPMQGSIFMVTIPNLA